MSDDRMQAGRDRFNLERYGTTSAPAGQPRPVPVGQEVEVRIQILCTDRDTHDPRRFGTAAIIEGALYFDRPPQGYGVVQVVDESGPAGAFPPSGSERRRFEFRCPTCGRSPQYNDQTLTRIVQTVAAAGLTSVDLSRLPANLISS